MRTCVNVHLRACVPVCVCIYAWVCCFSSQWTNILLASGNPLYDKPVKSRSRPLENPYNGLYARSNQLSYINNAFNVPDSGGRRNHNIADKNSDHDNDNSIYAELDEVAAGTLGWSSVYFSVFLVS